MHPPKKISLHQGISDEAVQQIAQNTIHSLLEEEAREEAERRKWDAAPVGTVMPDGSVYAGKTSAGASVYAMPQDEDGSTCMDFRRAQERAGRHGLDKTHGHDDWRLPTREELTLLFNNRAKIGNFYTKDIGWPCGAYWSATESKPDEVWGRYFPRGNEEKVAGFCALVTRCVRSGSWRPG